METIRGRKSLDLHLDELTRLLAAYRQTTLDLGTGDGRFVRSMAERHREHFFIGMDACRENLRANSQRRLPNALFVIARAQALPRELNGLADRITIHFPWGSLLESLLNGDTSLLAGFDAVTRPHAGMEIHLNADAVTAAGWELQAGAEQVERVLNSAAWTTRSHSCLNARDLRDVPTTWAKRLAFGRDPRAIRLSLQKG